MKIMQTNLPLKGLEHHMTIINLIKAQWWVQTDLVKEGKIDLQLMM